MSSQTTSVKAPRTLSEKQLAARRANARKSTGPKTPEGKARSARNALKHGFFAQTALLYYESPEDFVALRDAYIAEYSPQGPTEMHFVMEMANAQYRLRRVRGMEADLIQKLITRDLPARGLSNGEMQAEALRTLADDSQVLHLLQRYEVMFRRQYERALRLLWEHRDRLQKSADPKPRSRRPSRQPSPEALETLQALHALLLAPTPEPPAPEPDLPPAGAPSPSGQGFPSPSGDGCIPAQTSVPRASTHAPADAASHPPILRNEPKPASNRRPATPEPRPRRYPNR